MSAIPMIETKQQSLLRSTSLVSLMTFISRILGFARDMVLAFFFGTQPGMDAFFVAFRIPNFMRRLFAEGAFSQAFVPVLAEYQKTSTVDEVRLFLARIGGSLGFVLSIVTLIGIIATPLIVYLFAPGFGADSHRTLLATEMLRLTFPFLMFVSLTAMCGATLNTYGYFGVPAFTPVLLNICMILAALYLSPHLSQPVVGLAWGVLIAGVVQFLFQLPFLHHHQLLIKPQLVFHDEGVKKVMRLMVPALFGVSIAQLNLMVDSIFASFLREGSVSWLYYTDRLTDFPLGVFGVAIATVILPHLSRRNAANHVTQFSRSLDWGLRLLLLIGLPSGLGLAFFSMPLIATSFAYGHFIASDVLQTQKSLITLSLGVPAFMMVKVLASGFYARQNIKTPVKVGAIAMVVNTILCACFIKYLAHAGLTLASTLAGYLNCALLLILLLRRGIFKPSKGWWRFLAQLLVANTTLSCYLWLSVGSLEYWMSKSLSIRAGLILLHVFVAMVIYLIMLRISGVKLADFRGQFKESQ
jgi:putative peptidoglycan lipid II flippase